MPGSSLFTPEALASMRQVQRDAMPQTAHVLVRAIAREAGAVARQTWTLARSFACRLSRQTAEERSDDSRRQGVNANTLSYPYDEAPLDGTELVIVVGNEGQGERAFTRLFRVLASHGEKTFDTRRSALLTTHDVPNDVDPVDFLIP